MIITNARILANRLTGVHRYTLELLQRFGDRVGIIAPKRELSGIKGYAWEQFMLSLRISNDLLWSSSNTNLSPSDSACGLSGITIFSALALQSSMSRRANGLLYFIDIRCSMLRA